MASVRKSLVVSLLGSYLQIGLQLISYFVLARLLTPSDIGLFSVASSVLAIAQVVREFGVSTYLIQEKHLTDNKIATAFTITLLISISLFLLLFFVSPAIAAFYNDDHLIDVFRLLSLNFLVIPLNSTSLSLLRREMNFVAIFWINAIGMLVGLIIAVGFSWYGFGYYSLVFSSLGNSLAMAIAISFFRRGGLFHRLHLGEWRAVVHFGSQVTLTSISNELSTSASDLILGRVLGFAATGIVSRAQGIMYLFHRDITSAIRNVAFPAFANANRENKAIEYDYIKAVTILTVFAWPFYGVFSLFPVEALRLFFGPQWDAAGLLVPWFCAAGAVAASCSLIPVLLPALGGVKYLVKMHMIVDPLRVGAFAAAVYFFKTSEAFAITFLVFFVFSTILLFYFKNKLLPTDYRMLFIGFFKSLAVSLFALSLPALIFAVIYLESSGYWQFNLRTDFAWLFKTANQPFLNEWLFVIIGLLMLPCWLSALILFRHPLAEEAFFKKLVKIGRRHDEASH